MAPATALQPAKAAAALEAGKGAAGKEVAVRDTAVRAEKAIFAAGCFWGVEAQFRALDGVVATQAGYTGGKTASPTYRTVCSGGTGHAEAVEVEFDPAKVSYEKLLEVFWNGHDPTQVNRQGPDVGSQYRSAIFFTTPEQERMAKASKERLRASGKFRRPIATEIASAPVFNRAEEYHQHYYEKNGILACPK